MSDNNTKRFTFDPDKDNQEMPTLTSLIYGKKTNQNSQPSTTEGAFTLEPTRALDRNALLKELASMPTPGSPHGGSSGASSGSSSGAPPSPPRGPTWASPSSIASPLPASTPENADQVLGDFYRDRRLETSSPADGTARPFGLAKGSPYRADGGEHLDAHANTDLSRFKSPYGRVFTHLFQAKKITSAILFEPTSLAPGSFVATHAIEAGERAVLWRGTRFRPELFSDLWGRLQKFGYSEYSPVGLASQAHSFDRSAFRIAFGCEAKEWLTLILQPKISGSQLLLVFGPTSISAALPSALDRVTGEGAPAHGDASEAYRPPAPPKNRAA